MEFVFVFACDLETKPLIEPQRWIDLYNIQFDWQMGAGSVGDQAVEYRRADALALARTNNVKLIQEEGVFLEARLQPSNGGAVEGDDANLRQLPLFRKPDFMPSAVEAEGIEDPLIFGEVEVPRELVVLLISWAEADVHCSAR